METNKKNDFANNTALFLDIAGFGMLINGVIWALSDLESDKWFSRVSIGLICLGFSGIIYKIGNNNGK